MARSANPIPTYRQHKKTGRAIITVRDHTGARRDMLLPGDFNSKESKAEYDRVCTLLRVQGGRLPAPAVSAADLSMSELILRYMRERVESYYVNPATGKPTTERLCIGQALRPVNRLFGGIAVADFDSLKLDLVREAMISGAWMNDAERKAREKSRRPLGMARGTINKHVHRIRQMVRWAVAKKLVAPSLLTELQAVAPLEKGRTPARETDAVKPVDPAIVEATLPCLPPFVADMVRVQLLTGARPGEVCAMRVRQLDTTGAVWCYKPDGHKNAWRGHERIIAIGPQAQAILKNYLKPKLDAHLFSAREQDAVIKAEKRANRKSKVQPSQTDRSKPSARRKPRDFFSVTAYNRAVTRACERAGLPHWHVHQLRHAAALLIEREHGIEAARATLGHRGIDMTMHYSGLDYKRAAEVAAKIG